MAGLVHAQKLTATVSKNPVTPGEAFELKFTVDANGSGFQPPSLTDFDVLSGPQVFQQISNYNGNTTLSFTYSYYLSAKKEGKYSIGPAKISCAGKKLESNSIVLEVGKAGSQKQQGKGGQGGGDQLYVRASVNRTRVYQGEQVMLVYKVYTRLNLMGFQSIKWPAYTGFWTQDISNPKNLTVTKENVNGVPYNVAELKKTFLFPQRSGTLEIDPVEIDCVVRQQSKNQDPWNFFGPVSEDVLMKLKGQSIKIEVMPLPEGRPDNFSGAVGQFTMKAQLNKDKVQTNEAINLTISVSGKGSVNLLDPPKIKIPPDLESYDPKPTENISVNAAGVSGTKSNEYVIIPRYHGTYRIEQTDFSYFDPEKKSYISLHTPEFTIEVQKGAGDTSSVSVMAPAGNRKEVALIGTDIRYIKTGEVHLEQKGRHFVGSLFDYLGFAVPGTCFLAFLFWRKKHVRERGDERLMKSRKATRMAQKRLALAETHQRENKKERFYEEVFRALYGYLGDKLYMPVSDLSKESVSAALESKGVKQETISRLLKVIEACEFARYASGSASADLHGIYEQSVELITELEQEIGTTA
ncbi:MAG: BatD family protein [Bacteroidia bacterium]